MYVHRPIGRGRRWSVIITEGHGPLTSIREKLTFEIREDAWKAYKEIQLEIAATPEYISIEASLIKETKLALLIKYQEREIWFPKRVLTDNKDGTFILDKTWAYDANILS